MSHVPSGWPALVPRIAVDDAQGLVDFICAVFGAQGAYQRTRPSELRIGNALLLVGAAAERKTATAFLYVYVEDTDAAFQRAVERGAQVLESPADMPYGDRRAMVRDPWGNTWQVATHSGSFTPGAG